MRRGWKNRWLRLAADNEILALKAASVQVRYPSVYAPQSVQTGDFFGLTLVKITHQAGDLTQLGR